MVYFRAEKQIDQLGRIVVPAQIRHLLNIDVGDLLDVRLVEDHVEISKVEPRCTFCGSDQDLLEMHGRYACKRCSRDLSAATKVAKPRATKPDRRVVATR